MRRTELQALYEEQGISHVGLRKADLVALLKEAEAEQVDKATGGGYSDEGSDSENEGEGSADETLATKSEAIVALRLQVKLARVELEKEKVKAAARHDGQSLPAITLKASFQRWKQTYWHFFMR